MKPMGLIMRPCSMTEEENERVMRTGKYWTDSDFFKKYCEHIAAQQQISEAAKIFIMNNWAKVSDWSEMDIEIRDNTGKTKHYYKYLGSDGWNEDIKVIKQMNESRKKGECPVVSFDEVVLDPADGDFSVKINGYWHNWIDDDGIIQIADFIERNLNSEPNPERSVATEAEQGTKEG